MPRCIDWELMLLNENEKRNMQIPSVRDLLIFVLNRFKFCRRSSKHLKISEFAFRNKLKELEVPVRKINHPDIAREELQAEYTKNTSIRALADKYNTAESYIQKLIKKYGIKTNYKHTPYQYYATQEGFENICDLIYYYYWEKGWNQREIAEYLNISQTSIKDIMKQNHIETRKRNQRYQPEI